MVSGEIVRSDSVALLRRSRTICLRPILLVQSGNRVVACVPLELSNGERIVPVEGLETPGAEALPHVGHSRTQQFDSHDGLCTLLVLGAGGGGSH